MTFEGSTESELRQQLGEAWRQVAELQWQLQAEQLNSRRQDRLLASQDASIAESRGQHEQALADRDQDIADLEDEHQGMAIALEDAQRDGAQQAHWERAAETQRPSGSLRIGLYLLADVLRASALQAHNTELTAEFQKWERRVRIALDVEDEMDGRPADRLELAAILRRVVREHDARFAGSCVVEVDLTPGITPRQAILCAWLVDGWLLHACGPASQYGSSAACVSVRSVAAPPEIRISLSVADVSAAPETNLWRKLLQPCVTALKGHFDDDKNSGTVIAFPTGAGCE